VKNIFVNSINKKIMTQVKINLFEECIGFNDNKSHKLTQKCCSKPRIIRGEKGSPKRQAIELQKDPEAITSHRKHRPRCHSQESYQFIHNIDKIYGKYAPEKYIRYYMSVSRDKRGLELLILKD